MTPPSLPLSTRIARATALAGVFLAVACGGPPQPKTSPKADPTSEPKPEGGGSALSRAEELIKGNDFKGAQPLLEEEVAKHPKSAKARFLLGVVAQGTGQAAAAREHFEKALELDAGLTEAIVNLSALYIEDADHPDYKKALALVEKGLAKDAKNKDLLKNRAWALYFLEDSGAAAAMDGAVKAGAADDRLHVAYASLLLKAGKKDEALQEAKLGAQGSDPESILTAMKIMLALKNPGACVEALNGAIERKSSATLLVQRGMCKHQLKDGKGALADYEAATGADPKNAQAFFYLGMELAAAKKKSEARKAFEKVAELRPETDKLGQIARKELQKLK